MTREDDLLDQPVYFFCAECGTAYQYLYPDIYTLSEPIAPPRCHNCGAAMERVPGPEALWQFRDAVKQVAAADTRLAALRQTVRGRKA